MNANITDPARGNDILEWAQGVTEACRRFGGVGAPNMLLRDGVGGLGYEALPTNSRDRNYSVRTEGRFAATVIFEAQPDEEEGEEGAARKVKFENRYYDIAGRTLEVSSVGGEDIKVDLPDGEVLFALKVDATSPSGSAEIVTYTGDGADDSTGANISAIDKMQAEQEDTDNYITPLYLFKDGSLVCDFRTGPYIAMGEISL